MHLASPAASRYSAVKLTTDAYQFWVAKLNMRVTFQLHIWFARKVQKYGSSFSNFSIIYIFIIIKRVMICVCENDTVR